LGISGQEVTEWRENIMVELRRTLVNIWPPGNILARNNKTVWEYPAKKQQDDLGISWHKWARRWECLRNKFRFGLGIFWPESATQPGNIQPRNGTRNRRTASKARHGNIESFQTAQKTLPCVHGI
jgi:hypothetical protein